MREDNKDTNIIELEEQPIVLWIPSISIELTVIAKIYENGKVEEVQKTVLTKELRELFKDAEENYDDPNARYAITEKGLKWIKSLEKSDNEE